MAGDPKPPSAQEAFLAWKQEIQELIEAEKGQTVSLEGVKVDELTPKDCQYFKIWQRGGMDAKHLEAWSVAIPETQTSRLKLVSYCRQHQK